MHTKPLTDDQLREALAAAQTSPSKLEAARRLGLTRGAFEYRLREAQRRFSSSTAEQRENSNASERELLALRDRVSALQAEIKAIHRHELSEEKIRDTIFGLRHASFTPPNWLLTPGKQTSGPGVPTILMSDWHWGEVVDPAQINHINSFNLEIAHRRVRRLVERVVDLCFNHMVKPQYPGLVVALGGDMISGDIHEELALSNELASMPTILDLAGVLIWVLDTLADKFSRILGVMVPGNHGRTTKKTPFKDRAFTNFDWLVYHLLEMHFKAKGDARIKFLIPDAADAQFNIYDHRYLLTHGDNLGVRGGDGIIGALGPILRGQLKVRNSNAAVGRPFDTILMGHWHQYISLPHVIVNGALKGYDEYAHLSLRAMPQDPIQALWFTHPNRGITCSWPVNLADPEAEKAQAPTWTSWVAT